MEKHLSDEELETILIVARNRQSGRITEWEIKELVRVYRAATTQPKMMLYHQQAAWPASQG